MPRRCALDHVSFDTVIKHARLAVELEIQQCKRMTYVELKVDDVVVERRSEYCMIVNCGVGRDEE